jgi:hypothetical protein
LQVLFLLEKMQFVPKTVPNPKRETCNRFRKQQCGGIEKWQVARSGENQLLAVSVWRDRFPASLEALIALLKSGNYHFVQA